MKTQKFNVLLAFLLALGVTFTACEDEEKKEDPTQETKLTGTISKDMTISEDIFLEGAVIVEDGVTLSIEKGVTIVAKANDLSYLLVKQGGKLIAEGTADEPIVFTATTNEAGAWGGLHICGKAPINSGSTGLSEIGSATYGGDVAEDNSGSLKYVRVEYSGTTLDAEHEANGISFYGVGSGTTVDNVEVYVGGDDGIEFFGGTVNIKHVKVYGALDDSFDWTEGWSGKGQYLMVVQTTGGDRGFEGDNLGSDNAATPFANPTFSQVTLLGDGEGDGYGMKLREGTKGKIYNFIVSGFDKRSIHIEHDQTITNLNTGELVLDYGKINNIVSDKAIKYSGIANTVSIEASENIELLDLTQNFDATKTYSDGMDASSIDAWFDADSKIGSGADWASWMKSDNGDGSASTLNAVTLLSGLISEDTYVFENAELIGNVRVKDGATLFIKKGVTITADATDLSYLLVEQGGKIEAIGTADAPIVFTSPLEEAGAWGGLHICGKAPINSGSTGLSEIGEAVYGGEMTNDNSGTLKYVRVEYSGTILDAEHEANGISLYGVGNATTIDYIQVYVGADDGIEFFGGTVNVKHAYVYGAGDDSFDWTEGWSGKGQYLIAVQTSGGDRGFEGDNLGSDNAATPFANPKLSQITLIGDNEGNGYGMKLREGTKGNIYNFIVSNFDKRSIHVEHNQTISNVNNGELIVDFGKVNNQVSDAAIKYSGETLSVDDAKRFETSSNIVIGDFSTASIASTYSGGKDLSADDFFDASTQIGAGSDWTIGWSKN